MSDIEAKNAEIRGLIEERRQLREEVERQEQLIGALMKIPLYSDPKLGESRCIGCDCTEVDRLHDPYCPVARVEALLEEGE